MKEVTKKIDRGTFRDLRNKEERKEDEKAKKETRVVTKEDIEKEMAISVEERVTPYYKMDYKE